MDITKKITSFEAALEYNGETPEQFKKRTEHDAPHEVGFKKVCAIVLALNEGKVLDEGYYPWFWSARSSRGFSFGHFRYDCSSSAVAARHFLATPKLAIYAGNTFTAEYNEYTNG